MLSFGSRGLQHSPASWKYWKSDFLTSWNPGGKQNIYYPNLKPTFKPNPYPFLYPGWLNLGNAAGPGPGRAGSWNPKPLGGCAPQTPARFFSGRSGVQRHILYRHIWLFFIHRRILLIYISTWMIYTRLLCGHSIYGKSSVMIQTRSCWIHHITADHNQLYVCIQ